MSATPTPYKYDMNGCETSHGLPIILKANGHLLATLADRNEDTAAFIVKACNRRAALVNALRRLITAAEQRDNTRGDPCRLLECQAELRRRAREARELLD